MTLLCGFGGKLAHFGTKFQKTVQKLIITKKSNRKSNKNHVKNALKKLKSCFSNQTWLSVCTCHFEFLKQIFRFFAIVTIVTSRTYGVCTAMKF